MLYVHATQRFAPDTGLPETVTWDNGILQWDDGTTHDVLDDLVQVCRRPRA